MEQMELEINLAESEAKLKVLENFESPNEQQLPTHAPQAQHGDGMNEYLETYHENTDATVNSETSPVEFAKLGAIPKTPLQRYLHQQSKPIISSPPQNKNTITHMTLPQHGPTGQSSPQTATGGINMTNNNDLLTVMQRQNDIADLLVLQHKSITSCT